MSIEELFRRAETSGVDGAFTRIDEEHPIGLFLGLEGRRRAIMVVCPERPPEPPSLGALTVEIRPRQTGDWALVIRLERPDLPELFASLVQDLVDATRGAKTDPGEVVVSRLVRWQRMFSRRPFTLLDDNTLRGLAAELSFLIDEAVPVLGPMAAVQGWTGPYEAPKDFAFAGVEVEVKATRLQPRGIRITSLEQLTDSGLPLYLWCLPVELEQGTEDATRSFAALVGRARALVAGDAEAAGRLEAGLQAAGFEDRDEYRSRLLRFGTSYCYGVRGDFPRIQRPEVSAGVVACDYEVATAAIAGFMVDSWKGKDGNG